VIRIARTTKRTDLTVNKTICIPIGIVEKVLDEADLMNCSFSEAVSKLLLISLAVRRDQRMRDEKSILEEEKKILKARP